MNAPTQIVPPYKHTPLFPPDQLLIQLTAP